MKFTPTPIHGAYVVSRQTQHHDEHGDFIRTWCNVEAVKAGLSPFFGVQTSEAATIREGVTRGLHYQVAPHEEVKLVTVLRGVVYDIIYDARPDSPTHKKWHAHMLYGGLDAMTMYIPGGVAHGYRTMSASCVVRYAMDEFYHPESARTLDPLECGIRWPT